MQPGDRVVFVDDDGVRGRGGVVDTVYPAAATAVVRWDDSDVRSAVACSLIKSA